MKQDSLKKAAAEAALSYVKPDQIVGVGTGSTVAYFIEALASMRSQIEGAVASSMATEAQLRAHHIPILDLNTVSSVDLYVDGADEATMHRMLIKGRGGALTREKIIASASERFICIMDATKQVDLLGQMAAVPVEVIPMARSLVARCIVAMGGDPVYRAGYVTDNGNVILDVYNLSLRDPHTLEDQLNTLPGVVENGIFAARPADLLLVASQSGISTI